MMQLVGLRSVRGELHRGEVVKHQAKENDIANISPLLIGQKVRRKSAAIRLCGSRLGSAPRSRGSLGRRYSM